MTPEQANKIERLVKNAPGHKLVASQACWDIVSVTIILGVAYWFNHMDFAGLAIAALLVWRIMYHAAAAYIGNWLSLIVAAYKHAAKRGVTPEDYDYRN